MRTSSTRASINCALRASTRPHGLPPCSSALRTWLQQARNCARRLLPPAKSCDLHRATRPWRRLLRAGSRRRRVCPRRRLLRSGSRIRRLCNRRCVRLARRLLRQRSDTHWSCSHITHTVHVVRTVMWSRRRMHACVPRASHVCCWHIIPAVTSTYAGRPLVAPCVAAKPSFSCGGCRLSFCGIEFETSWDMTAPDRSNSKRHQPHSATAR